MEKFSAKNAEIYLKNILHYAPGSIYWKDLDGVYLGCNQMQADLAGLQSPENMIGKTDYDMSWRDLADVLNDTDKRIMRTGKSEELIETPRLHNGHELVMLTNKAPLFDEDDKIIGIIGTSLDITARIKAEEREKKARMAAIAAETQIKIEEEVKRATLVLAGSMAHDLRTPLLSLNLINHQLKKLLSDLTGNTTELSELTLEIDTVMRKMHQFIDHNLKALKYSTADSLMKETLIDCQSNREINSALSSYPFKSNEKGLITVDHPYNFVFLGNPIFFSRIIFNLLNNSLYQIHKNKRGHIFIATQVQDNHNIIHFKDTAGGASPEIIDHIFDGYRTTKESGTGIGLAFCKITMESFGGNITCAAVEGEFIEFILTFPKVV